MIKLFYKILLFSLLISIFFVFGCKKKDVSTEENVNARIDSTFICGFIVKINASGIQYNAVNLPNLYKKDSLKVTLSYHLLNTKYQCFLGDYPQIYIDAIHLQP